MEITELLMQTKRANASDLHLSPGHPPILRLHGEITPMKGKPLEPDQVKDMLYSIMNEQQRVIFERDLELDFAIQFGEEMRFRVNAFTNVKGPAISLRNVPSHVFTLDELEMPPILKRMASLSKGLVLVTGPTGSGKSVTLAAMVDHINSTARRHILTIEDPVELIHKPRKCLVNQRELGSNTRSFAQALRSALREDPDVILVGELRDQETIQLALTAAETGHLVMATLHTNSAYKTIDRIIDVFPESDKGLIMSMLSTSLEGVISQTLIRTIEGKGRVAAQEILVGTSAVRNLIRENKVPQIYSLIQVGSRYGMTTMKESVYALLDKGVIHKDDAMYALNMYSDSVESELTEEKKDHPHRNEVIDMMMDPDEDRGF
ncbi:MAG: type IV pilus twitching motility protein PilT [Hyphomicrobiales bacterium]|nr:type IV pilus twitching motility protein PilT [Rickettsiales bacterium]MCP5361678.1 type IV pilus twitching motility protein PilT [Hyphomicrobiales bacterium]